MTARQAVLASVGAGGSSLITLSASFLLVRLFRQFLCCVVIPGLGLWSEIIFWVPILRAGQGLAWRIGR